MARRKARQRISYVLPLANSPGGHRLGVNSLAFDNDNSILYSAGRDGVLCAWNVSHPTGATRANGTAKKRFSTFGSQVQAHTHWVNDIILAHSKTALVSASSDITVKVWRPSASDGQSAVTIGQHQDYVKCLAAPEAHSDWVASGGLDNKIKIWDLDGAGERLVIDTGEAEGSAKGSVYALSVRGSLMASGGPDSVLRLWDPKSGKRITKFVGHTDNLRDILINESGDTIMTASSDQTIKIWSMAAGRCMSTLTMHNDSVWSLHSDHPQLSIFYSADRSGLIAKTDVRGSPSMDQGLSMALAQDHGGVTKILASEGSVWSATSSSSINRWHDVDTTTELASAESPRQARISSLVSRPSITRLSDEVGAASNEDEDRTIPLSCVLKISNAAPTTFREFEGSISGSSIRRQSEITTDGDIDEIVPFHRLPDETIEGQNGLIKHELLNDRKRVLTLDTAGEVILWDLLKCIPIKSFGKRHLDDVRPEVDTMESIANWCTINTRAGRLAVALEENYCFDAEMYADQADIERNIDFKEDQRSIEPHAALQMAIDDASVNLGKWVLRYLFAGLIDEEIRRDEAYRNDLKASLPSNNQQSRSLHLGTLPPRRFDGWQKSNDDSESITTPRAVNGLPAMTPGLSIGVASPGLSQVVSNNTVNGQKTPLGGTGEEKRSSGDYFTNKPPPAPDAATDKTTDSSSEGKPETTQSPTDADKETKSSSLFGKKLKLSFPKKLGGRPSVEVAKPVVIEDKSDENSDKSSEKEEKPIDDNFHGVVQRMRIEYDSNVAHYPQDPLITCIQPSLPSETPVLKPPPLTSIIIQEDNPDSGGLADLYRGTVGTAGQDADLIEGIAPTWLGDLLLRNRIPDKDIVKVSFVLQPYQDLLPGIAGPDGNTRLNANRMLRAKKIIAYVTDRIDPDGQLEDDPLKPEEYIDLYCHEQLVPHNMTLATLRAHVWKTGGDVMLYYRSNGRKPELERAFREEKERIAARERAVEEEVSAGVVEAPQGV